MRHYISQRVETTNRCTMKMDQTSPRRFLVRPRGTYRVPWWIGALISIYCKGRRAFRSTPAVFSTTWLMQVRLKSQTAQFDHQHLHNRLRLRLRASKSALPECLRNTHTESCLFEIWVFLSNHSTRSKHALHDSIILISPLLMPWLLALHLCTAPM